MGFRRYMLALRTVPTNVIKEGEKTHLNHITKGENLIFDAFIRDILRLPEKTKVFHCNSSKILPAIEFIGGREIRPIGDTCRMFFKLKLEGRTADYFFWDGIVTGKIHLLGDDVDGEIYDIVSGLSSLNFQDAHSDVGLATGRTLHRMVLTEKIKKGSPFPGKP